MGQPLYDTLSAEQMPERSKARLARDVREVVAEAEEVSRSVAPKGTLPKLPITQGYDKSLVLGAGLASFSSAGITARRVQRLSNLLDNVDEVAESVHADDYGPLAHLDLHSGRKAHDYWFVPFAAFNEMLPDGSWMKLGQKHAKRLVYEDGLTSTTTPGARRMPLLPPVDDSGRFDVIAGSPYSGKTVADFGSERKAYAFRNELTVDVYKALHLLLMPESKVTLFYPESAAPTDKFKTKADITASVVVESLINSRRGFAVAANLDPRLVVLDFDACLSSAFESVVAGESFVTHFCRVTGGKVLLTSVTGRDNSGHVIVAFPSVAKACLAVPVASSMATRAEWKRALDLDQEKLVAGKYARVAGVDVLHSAFGHPASSRGNQMVRLPYSPNKPNGMSNAHANSSWIVAPFPAGPSTVTDVDPQPVHGFGYADGVSFDVRELGEILTERYAKVAEAFASDGVDYEPASGPRNVTKQFVSYASELLSYVDKHPLSLGRKAEAEPDTVGAYTMVGRERKPIAMTQTMSREVLSILNRTPVKGARSDYAIMAFNAYVSGHDVDRIDAEAMYDEAVKYPAFEKLRVKKRKWGVAWLERELRGTSEYRAAARSKVGENARLHADTERREQLSYTDYVAVPYDEYSPTHPVQRLRPWMVKFVCAVTRDDSLVEMSRHLAAAACLAALLEQANWELYSTFEGKRPVAKYSAITVSRMNIVAGVSHSGAKWSHLVNNDPRRALAREGLAEFFSDKVPVKQGEVLRDAGPKVSSLFIDPSRYDIDMLDDSVDEADVRFVAEVLNSPLTFSLAGPQVILHQMVRRDADAERAPKMTAREVAEMYASPDVTENELRRATRCTLNDLKKLSDLGLVKRGKKEKRGKESDVPFAFTSRNTDVRGRSKRLRQVRLAAASISVARRNLGYLKREKLRAFQQYEDEVAEAENGGGFARDEEKSRRICGFKRRKAYARLTARLKDLDVLIAHARRVYWLIVERFARVLPNIFGQQRKCAGYAEAVALRSRWDAEHDPGGYALAA